MVLGYGAQNTFTTMCSRVNVDILPKRTNVTVAIWAITATAEPSTTPTEAPDAGSLKTYLDSVFGKQANVFVTVLPLVSTNVNYDLDTNGFLDVSIDLFTSEQAAITSVVYLAGAYNVYYVRAFNPSSGLNGVSSKFPGYSFIQDSHENSTVNITAHELAHQFRIGYDIPQDVYGNYDRLMWGSPPVGEPCRLSQSEWQRVNNTAGKDNHEDRAPTENPT